MKKMNNSFNKEMWISVLVFIILAAGVFYISFSVEQNSLSLSLFGLFFILFMSIPVTVMEHRIKSKNYSLWGRTITNLVLVNIIFFVTFVVVFSRSIFYYLAFAITYTFVQIIITSVKYKPDSE